MTWFGVPLGTVNHATEARTAGVMTGNEDDLAALDRLADAARA